MSYESFIDRVFQFLNSVGGGYRAKFSNNENKYIADCYARQTGEVIRVTGNPISIKLTVRFGAKFQHTAMV